MSRSRLIPSLNYRSKGVVDMTLSNQVLKGFDLVEVYIASNVNDAHDTVPLVLGSCSPVIINGIPLLSIL